MSIDMPILSLGTPCSVADEDTFGPTVNNSCHHGFDFTLLFEETILALLPLAIFLILAPIEIRRLHHASEKVERSWRYAAKGVFHSMQIALQFILLILWCRSSTPKTRATVPTAAVSLAASLCGLYLSHLDHCRSLRPSTILGLFLSSTLLFDLTRIRTLSFLPHNETVTFLFVAAWAIKAIVLTLESTEKRSLLKKAFAKSACEDTSSVFNRGLFWWLNIFMWKGSKTTLTVDDLPVLDEDVEAASNPEDLLNRWNKANKHGRNALLWTMIAHYKWAYFAGSLPRLAYTGFAFTQPFLVERVLNFMEEPDHVNSKNYANGLIMAYAIVHIGIAITFAVYQHKIFRLTAMLRGSLVSLIFDKTLRLNTSSVSDATAVTLMSTDMERIQNSLLEMHEVYCNFIEIALALWFLARLLGIATIASLAIVLVCLGATVPLAIASGNAQGDWLEAVEDRVAVTSKVLGVMKNIKMTGLTNVAARTLRNLRSDEIKSAIPFRLYNVINVTISYASLALSPVFGFGVYILLAQANGAATITNGLAFSALTLFLLLDIPMVSIADGAEDLMAVVNCLQRIQKYLLETERTDCRSILHSEERPLIDLDTNGNGVSLCAKARGLSVSWSIDDEPILSDLSFDIDHNKTTMIVGPVGCGKSTLLKALLGEVPECSGLISVAYKHAAYCNQSPWVTFGTVQQNIIGASPWDQSWYDRVVQACALRLDLQQLPAGDQTKVGVQGSRLSGGQQIRVALARALYSRKFVLILDDVLTGLDRETESFILESVFGRNGLLKQISRTVVLATNSAHHLSYADHIISIDANGKLAEQGSYEALFAARGAVPAISNQPDEAKVHREPEVVFDDEALQELQLEDDEMDHVSRQTGDFSVYLYYFEKIGWRLMTLIVASSVMFTSGFIFPQIWLQKWTQANEQHPNENIGYWLGVYAALGVFTLVAAFFGSWVFGMVIVPKTARKLHEVLLETTMRATTSYLTSTDIGTTTNRFSQDLELIDDELPSALELTVNAILSCIFEGFLVFVGSNYIIAATIPLCALVIYYVARYYVKTSRQVRLLDIEAKAPLFSHFLEALSGLTSIRAYGWTEDYRLRTQIALDTSQRPYYMLSCIQRWLGLVLDLIVAAIAVLVVSGAFAMKGNSSLNLLGITLFNIVNFSATLQTLIKEWTGLETSIGAVSRIRSYVRQAKTEDLDGEAGVVPASWPLHGNVEIRNVSASYDGSPEPVLRDINLKILGGEKIALCGRTGSGKSSLISTILRTLEIDSGEICIDGMDISRISRSHIRSCLNTIPQQAFFLAGSVRLNANPQEDVSDVTIIEALQTVNLWTYLESKGGLDTEMTDELLSHGQQQLFCMARALCRSSKIVIMDEATSSVDSGTEALMQEVIRTRFKDQTLVTIAHKLDSVLDYDKIVFLDHGKVIEFDTPQNLLSRGDSAFKSLYDSFRRRQA